MFIYMVALLSVASARPRDLDRILYKRRDGGCGQTVFNESYGIIETPYYPNNYGDNMDCVYTINGNSTSRVNFFTCVCDIEDETACSWDYIEFGGKAQRHCGEFSKNTFSENFANGVVEVVFHSDSSVNRGGCQISYGVNASLSELSSQCPASNRSSPSNNWTGQLSNWSTPSYNLTSPPSNWTTPFYNVTAPPSNWTTPFYNVTAPPSNWTTPLYNLTAPPSNWTSSFNWTDQPSNQTTTPFYDC